MRGERVVCAFFFSFFLRVVERTCLLRACVNQQLAGPGEERETEREREREAVLAGRWSMPNGKRPRMASAVLSRWVKHDEGREGWRETRKKETLQTPGQMTTLVKKTRTHSLSHQHTLAESNSHLLYSLDLSLSYIQRAGPADP